MHTQTRGDTRVAIRPFTEADYPALAALWAHTRPDHPMSAAEIQQDDRARGDEYYLARWVAERDGTVIGSTTVAHTPWLHHPRKYSLVVHVHPSHRRQGVGAALYDLALGHALERDPLVLRTWVRESEESAVRFAQARGFQEQMRYWQSRLDLATFDASRFDGARERVAAQGIQVRTLRDLRAEPDFDRRLYEMFCEIERDVPAPETRTSPSFDFWRRFTLERPNLLEDGFFIALDGEKPVGTSALWSMDGTDGLDTGLTGVLRSHRRRGIALALKLHALDWARQRGAPYVMTDNESNNRPMLSINEALGFERLPAWIDMARVLKAEDGG